MTRIYLSPSSQTWNLYSAGGTNECDQCYRIAQYAEQALIKNGYTVKLAAKYLPYMTAIAESNAFGADVHIPIHTNAGGGRGCELFCWPASTTDKYVTNIYRTVDNVVPNPGRGIKTSPVWDEVRLTNAVCAYLECEFHDNATYAQWIIDNVKVLGEAIARGVCAADGKEYRPLDEPVVVPPPKPPVPPAETGWYRVRTDWNDPRTQIGAFKVLDNAIKAARNANPYKVFDDAGNEISIYDTPAPEPEIVTYIVVSGDTLWDIANRYGTTVQELSLLNGFTAEQAQLIKPGQKIRIA